MPNQITIHGHPDFTLRVGDGAVVETVRQRWGIAPPNDRAVVTVTRILGRDTAPYVEVRREDGRYQLFTARGDERGKSYSSDFLRRFDADVEAEHQEQVKQFERGQVVAKAIRETLVDPHKLIHTHPELVADFEALLTRIAAITSTTKP